MRWRLGLGSAHVRKPKNMTANIPEGSVHTAFDVIPGTINGHGLENRRSVYLWEYSRVGFLPRD